MYIKYCYFLARKLFLSDKSSFLSLRSADCSLVKIVFKLKKNECFKKYINIKFQKTYSLILLQHPHCSDLENLSVK